jgi:hypothetical protein
MEARMEKGEILDLSHLIGTPERKFEKTITLGKEIGRLEVSFSRPPAWQKNCIVVIAFHGGKGKPHRVCRRIFPLEVVPATLTRGMVRLGATDAYMLKLQEA